MLLVHVGAVSYQTPERVWEQAQTGLSWTHRGLPYSMVPFRQQGFAPCAVPTAATPQRRARIRAAGGRKRPTAKDYPHKSAPFLVAPWLAHIVLGGTLACRPEPHLQRRRAVEGGNLPCRVPLLSHPRRRIARPRGCRGERRLSQWPD